MAVNVGVIGCGNISGIYLENSCRFPQFNIIACADLDKAKAEEAARKYGVESVYSVEEMIASPDIDMIMNLTVPHAHAAVALEAIEQKKHVYSEKPLAVSLEDGKRIMEAARLNNVTVGSAPDTFLGGSIQLAGQLMKDGVIGKPVGATAFMMSRGPESWHPNPEFFYHAGGGPMFDMGPYYLTALVSLMGPVNRITGSARITFPERTITSEAKYGEKITVQVPTHVTGILDFINGATATITTSFDVSAARTPFIEIYGEEGTISLPDPNHFNQPILVKRHDGKEWKEIKPEGDALDNLRGIGLADMAEAIKAGRQPRANGEMALHVLEIMHGIHLSSEQGRHYIMESSCNCPPLIKQPNAAV
ncbi:Gfo/Idh/MocA family oxidoreductase [Domibacillus indicus]|uniref:Gfo/Idh/MocA family protein n=1 Tax=Domibacillus indicus TaxID=1437523 RepID=UPI002041B66C|nr:Gfo/Idh/MocA family oxidoreductase [Domibacillus indicus]MCM3790284.1 Gfo/Idh/MocA family oxidoreductase [Domibacillus indicus]